MSVLLQLFCQPSHSGSMEIWRILYYWVETWNSKTFMCCGQASGILDLTKLGSWVGRAPIAELLFWSVGRGLKLSDAFRFNCNIRYLHIQLAFCPSLWAWNGIRCWYFLCLIKLSFLCDDMWCIHKSFFSSNVINLINKWKLVPHYVWVCTFIHGFCSWWWYV